MVRQGRREVHAPLDLLGQVVEDRLESGVFGLLGDPIYLGPDIDSKGYLVGVMGIWIEPKKTDEKDLEAGGEDMATIYDLLQTEN